MNAQSKELGVANGIIHDVFHEDFRYGSYVLRRGQFVKEPMQERRLTRAKKLLSNLKHPKEPISRSSFLMRKMLINGKNLFAEMTDGCAGALMMFQADEVPSYLSWVYGSFQARETLYRHTSLQRA